MRSHCYPPVCVSVSVCSSVCVSPLILYFYEAYGISLMSVYLRIPRYFFRFLFDPCCIKRKKTISSSQGFLLVILKTVILTERLCHIKTES
jgi:hypothetical protein